MTAQDHNKIIGTLFAIFGGVSILLLIPVTLQVLTALGELQNSKNQPNVEGYLNLLLFVFIIVAAFVLVAAILQITAGYGILKHKSWARSVGTIAAVAAIISLISFPIGTALGIYTLWFMYGEKGKQFYGSVPFA